MSINELIFEGIKLIVEVMKLTFIVIVELTRVVVLVANRAEYITDDERYDSINILEKVSVKVISLREERKI